MNGIILKLKSSIYELSSYRTDHERRLIWLPYRDFFRLNRADHNIYYLDDMFVFYFYAWFGDLGSILYYFIFGYDLFNSFVSFIISDHLSLPPHFFCESILSCIEGDYRIIVDEPIDLGRMMSDRFSFDKLILLYFYLGLYFRFLSWMESKGYISESSDIFSLAFGDL